MDPQYAYQSAPMNTFPMRMPPELMAEGGLAAAARQVQSKGRDGDSMLVHMAPGEVKGLQALAMAHGGSLTINPTTGLPEANFLKRIMPMVLGAGLSMIPGVGPLMAAGLVGAGYGVAKGSLQEGLMAGLSAYGGAGLASGLTAAGAAAPASTAATLGVPGAATGAGSQASMLAAQNAGFGQAGVEATRQAAATAAGANVPSAIGSLGTTTQQGLKSLASGAGREAFAAGLPKYAGTAAVLGGASALTPEAQAPKLSETHLRPYEFAWNQDTGVYEPSPVPGDTSERRYFNPVFTPLPIQRVAQGGEIKDPTDEMSQDGGYAKGGETGLDALAKKRKSLSGDKYYTFADDRRDKSMEASIEQNFAKGGLGQALPPRFLSGGGDGMSDSIKANIDGIQEARLADGEFVVPADVVSHLGNGSSKAGAKKLYAMMDKIRKARTGTKRQAPEVNAAKYMPA